MNKRKSADITLYEEADYSSTELNGPCMKCNLWEAGCTSPKMIGSGPRTPHYFIIGEAPGEEEDEEGTPFVGKSGKFLRDMLEAMDIDPHNVYFTNTVRCRPPGNRTPTAKEIGYCAAYLAQEIAYYKPDVIMLLGNVPLKAVLGESGITNWNGVVVNREEYTYVPAFHPSFLIRNGVPDDLLDQWVYAFDQAKAVVDGTSNNGSSAADDYTFVYPTTMDDIRKMFNDVIRFVGPISYDSEAKYLQPEREGNKILSVSLATDVTVYSFPLYHQESWWSDAELDVILFFLRKILTNKRIRGHNLGFDCKITRALLDIDFYPAEDTMLVSQLVDATKGRHGLKRLAGRHVGMFDYDKELQDYKKANPEADYDKGGNYDNVPLTILLPYGAKDSVATYKVHDILFPDLTPQQRILYEQLLMKASYTLGRIEEVGFNIDKNMAAMYERLYGAAMRRLYAQMAADPDVRRYEADREAELNTDHNARRKWKTFQINPNSRQHIADVFYIYKGHEVLGYTETGLPSVTIDLLKQLKDIEPLFIPYREWKLYSTVMSKYLVADSSALHHWGDNRVHAHYNIGGTKTGRLSSSDPNMQNIPTPEKEPGTLLERYPIKNLFIHTWKRMPEGRVRRILSRTPKIILWPEETFHPEYVSPTIDDGGDGCIMGADYSGMELRVMASLANVPGMIKAFEDDIDVHSFVTSLLNNEPVEYLMSVLEDKKHKDYDRVKALRYRAKWVNWTLLFGGDWHTLFRLYGIPKKEAESLMDLYYGVFPEILDFQTEIATFARENGFVESVFGRRLYVPYINDTQNGRETSKAAEDKRTAMNFPIQSAASDTLLCALCVIDTLMIEQGFQSRIINTVHDSISFDVFPGEASALAALTQDVMENIPEYAKIFFPDINFEWLRVGLKADVEFGHRYAQV